MGQVTVEANLGGAVGDLRLEVRRLADLVVAFRRRQALEAPSTSTASAISISRASTWRLSLVSPAATTLSARHG